MVARSVVDSVPVEVRLLEGEVNGLAPASCSDGRMGDGTEWGDFGAAQGAEHLFTGGVIFSEPRPGGLVGDGKFVSTLERTGHCLRLTVEVGVFGLEDLTGTD
jgi:hypothetical protein